MVISCTTVSKRDNNNVASSEIKMKKTIFLTLAFICLQSLAADYPKTTTAPAIDEYHGVKVIDNYQWLEKSDGNDVKEWTEKQNKFSAKHLEALPFREAIADRVKEIKSEKTKNYYAAQRVGKKSYFLTFQPPKEQSFLVEIDPDGDLESQRVLLDPELLDENGSVAIDWFKVSPNGQYVGASLSKGGSEVGDLHIFDLKSLKLVGDPIARVNIPTAGGDMEWLPDSSGFYYTRYPREGERVKEEMNFYQQVYFHKIGTPEKADQYEIGKDFSRISEIIFEVEKKSGQVLLTEQYGDSGKFRHFLKKEGKWLQLSDYKDEIVQTTFIDKDRILGLSRKGAPNGKFVIFDTDETSFKSAKTIVPETDTIFAIDFYNNPPFIIHNDKIVAKIEAGGPSELKFFDLSGKELPAPELPQVSGFSQILSWGNSLLARNYSYFEPNTWIQIDSNLKTVSKHPLSSTSSVKFDGYVATREFAKSKDGTMVPVNILHKDGIKLNSKHPLLLTGYGGYGLSIPPFFDPMRKVWLEQGGIIAVANIRGGGEFGEKWHQEGMLTKKQNVFDDFAAVMQHLIDRGYTSKEKLAIEGGSNGGLLMGAMITQHPDLFAAVVSHVGIYDSLRSETTPNGEFNIPEFGTVTKKDQFSALYAYSPYHNIKDKTMYPSVLLMAGENDGRVESWHSKKMAARLQSANASDSVILLRTSSSSGHGMGTALSEEIAQDTDRLAFLFSELKVPYKL